MEYLDEKNSRIIIAGTQRKTCVSILIDLFLTPTCFIYL